MYILYIFYVMFENILNGPLEINEPSVLKGYRFLNKSYNNKKEATNLNEIIYESLTSCF